MMCFTMICAPAEALGATSLTPNVRAIALIAATLPVTLAVAVVSYEFTEKPRIASGKRTVGRLTEPAATARSERCPAFKLS